MTSRTNIERLIAEVLPPLDRALRASSVSWVAERAFVITAEEALDDVSLVAALCRVAQAAVGKSGGRSVEVVDDEGAAQGDPDREAAAAERDQRTSAERRDRVLVALAAAKGMLEKLRSRPPMTRTVDGDTVMEVCFELARPGQFRLIRERALELARAVVDVLPSYERQFTVGVERLRSLVGFANGDGATGFVRAEAVSLLAAVLEEQMVALVTAVLEDRETKDAMVVRARAVRCVPGLACAKAQKLSLLQFASSDPSEHVRQEAARALRAVATPDAYAALASIVSDENSPRVAGVALLQLGEALSTDRDAAGPLESSLIVGLGAGALLQRCALAVLDAVGVMHRELPISGELADALQNLIRSGELELAESAAMMVRGWQVDSDQQLLGVKSLFEHELENLVEGQSTQLTLPESVRREQVEMVVCVLSADDFPVSIRYGRKRRLRVTRGERRRFRLWRLGYELAHPAPDKRQNYLHDTARTDDGDAVSVPLRLAEVTPTRVPGERHVVIGQCWGGFLPRVDDLLFVCERGRSRRLLSVLGTLSVMPPPGWLARQRARWFVNRAYVRLAEARERALLGESPAERGAFVRELRQLGFEFRWESDEVLLPNASLHTRPQLTLEFFSLGLPFSLWIEDAIQYVLMPRGNTAWHLAVVVWVLLSFMLARAAYVLTRFEKARKNIPLSIGGWGSRGKSGTERLKAALFHSLHFDVVSKTTGCEAMIIVARRGQPASEVFLYRPYDKATIWEQAKVVEYAQALGAQVFLWECMALQPEFVDILNKEWMRDTVTTLTNAYPDHEDVMGPSGEDVARTIAQFVPRDGTVLCSEDQMLPIVRQSARRNRSRLIDVGGLEADLLPRDLLGRFPYDEHPRNIALVLRLAEHFGVDRERALFDLADFVFPDLGVLKTFPIVHHKCRKLRFSNGMSANERAGFLSNWRRLGFEAHSADALPGRLIVAVVNNRADRVPRSRVFAELLVRDVKLDAIIVIGTNQWGMRSFIAEEAARQAADLNLPDGPSEARRAIERCWDRLGAPRELETVKRRLEVFGVAVSSSASAIIATSRLLQLLDGWADGTPVEPSALDAPLRDAISKLCDELLADADGADWRFGDAREGRQELATLVGGLVRGFAERVVFTRWYEEQLKKGGAASAAEKVRRAFEASFLSKVFVLPDSSSTGDQVIDFVAHALPPGLEWDLLGCQNIKGTGLDFVYRFTSYERVTGWLRKLEEQPEERTMTLSLLLAHADYGLFDSTLAYAYVHRVLEENSNEWQPHQVVLRALRDRLDSLRTDKAARLRTAQRQSLLTTVCGWFEPFVDHLDAVRRHRRAVHTMKQLVAGKISQARAVETLRDLTARQKGGWLAKDLQHAFDLSKWIHRSD